MFKKMLVVITVCIYMTSCGISSFERNYIEELTPKMHEEFVKQGICNTTECDAKFLVGDQFGKLIVDIYVPKKNNNFDYSSILDIVNDIYIRDNINIVVTVFNGGIKNGKKERKTKKIFKVKYYAY